MQAEFVLKKCTGSSAGTETDCSFNPCLLNADIVSTDISSYQIAIPGDSGSSPNYSYETWLIWVCTAAPTNYCNNFKIWGPSSRPGDDTYLTILMGTTATGATPTDSASSVATLAQHSNYYSSSNALSVGTPQTDDKITAVSQKTDYIVAQLKVEYGAVITGEIGNMVYNFSYDES